LAKEKYEKCMKKPVPLRYP